MAHAWLLLCASASALVAPVRRRATTPLKPTARGVLWTPDADYVKTTAMDRFQKAMSIEGNYEQLWDCLCRTGSVLDAAQDFLDVEGEGRRTCQTGDTMPDVSGFLVKIKFCGEFAAARERSVGNARP